MKIYIGESKIAGDHILDKIPVLYSYFYNKNNPTFIKFKTKCFLDSGAFSAFTKKINIDIQKYATFIHKYNSYFEVYANLDVIGDPESTIINQKILENEFDLNPLPCFHYGEPIKYLKHYLDNYDYLALGGMVPISIPALQIWLDELFSKYLLPKKIKVHGFGLTDMILLQRYPWYSVDSTTPSVAARMGECCILFKNNLYRFTVSIKRQNVKENIINQSVEIKKILIDKIESKNYTLQQLSEDAKAREEINILFFHDFQKQITENNKTKNWLFLKNLKERKFNL